MVDRFSVATLVKRFRPMWKVRNLGQSGATCRWLQVQASEAFLSLSTVRHGYQAVDCGGCGEIVRDADIKLKTELPRAQNRRRQDLWDWSLIWGRYATRDVMQARSSFLGKQLAEKTT